MLNVVWLCCLSHLHFTKVFISNVDIMGVLFSIGILGIVMLDDDMLKVIAPPTVIRHLANSNNFEFLLLISWV
jgi:hypothetical protein